MKFTKNLLVLALAASAPFVLNACNKSADPAANAPAAAAPAEVVAAPTDPADTAGWKKYLASVVMQNMDGVKTNRPYMYFIPAGGDDKALDDRANQLENVQGVVGRGVLPGNMMAFGGPDSAATVDFVIEAFKNATANSFKDVVVLVVGKPEDQARVTEALATSGATVRIAGM